MKKNNFVILIFLFITVIAGASTLLVFDGKYEDDNVTLNIRIKQSSSIIINEKGERVGRSNHGIEFRLIPIMGKDVKNPEIKFQNKIYNLSILKDEYDNNTSAYIDIMNEKKPYTIEFSYSIENQIIAKRLTLKPGKAITGGISDIHITVKDISKSKKR